MQLNDGEKEWREDLCAKYVAAQAVPELVKETKFLPMAGSAANMLTCMEGATDEQWVGFLEELASAANEHGSIAQALIFKVFAEASPPFSRVWELVSKYAPKIGEDDAVHFGLSRSDFPLFRLSWGCVQQADDVAESVFLFKESDGSWITRQVTSPEILLLMSLPMLMLHANAGPEDPMALAALREFFLTAWKKRRDDAKARFEDAQYAAQCCEKHGAHLYRQLQVFSFGEQGLRRNYRVRRAWPSPNTGEHSERFMSLANDFSERHSCVLELADELEDAFFIKRDVSTFLKRPFLNVAEEILRNEELDQVLIPEDSPVLLTHERFIEES